MQTTLSEVERSLQGGGSVALNQLLGQAPATLVPTEPVVQAALGTDPATDLPRLVTDLDRAGTILTAHDGQLGKVLDALNQTSAALGNESVPVGDTLAALPQTLTTTRSGMTALRGTLAQLTSTAQVAQPSIQRLNPLLTALNPPLVKLKPLLDQLQPLLQEAKPLVNQLVPTATSGTTILDELRGPVLAKVNGPIIGTITGYFSGSQLKGSKKYAGGGNDTPSLLGYNNKPQKATFYQELGWFLSNLDRSCQTYDHNGFLTNLTFTVGPGSIGAIPTPIQKTLGNILGVGIPGAAGAGAGGAGTK